MTRSSCRNVLNTTNTRERHAQPSQLLHTYLNESKQIPVMTAGGWKINTFLLQYQQEIKLITWRIMLIHQRTKTHLESLADQELHWSHRVTYAHNMSTCCHALSHVVTQYCTGSSQSRRTTQFRRGYFRQMEKCTSTRRCHLPNRLPTASCVQPQNEPPNKSRSLHVSSLSFVY